ncbi:hypothetical protein ZWY2020_000561 [Hordeum vulgare]|nr:hypothetical protein ZWY2020_000561 [Hordeum vulgare]
MPSDAATGGRKDRLSALSVDLLIHILVKLWDSRIVARTSVLARRRRRVWALLPELIFPAGTDPDGIRSALAAHDAPALRHLFVDAIMGGPAPESATAWLPIAAGRLSGVLHLKNWLNMDGSRLKLPCFHNATEIILDLGLTVLTLPPSGVFTRLAHLELVDIWLHGGCSLGDVVSSRRSPSLQRLSLRWVRGLDNLTIHSESLVQLGLRDLPGLQQLNVVALLLQTLLVCDCFSDIQGQPVANISAPQLVSLNWRCFYDPSSVLLDDNMPHLQQLTTNPLFVYGRDALFSTKNRHWLTLLQHFDHISSLYLSLLYPRLSIERDDRFLIEDMIKFPRITSLTLIVMACGHSFGASSFHVLRMSSGIRRFELRLLDRQSGLEAYSPCQSGCICAEPSKWETEELVLPCLKEVAIVGLRGTEHELALVKRLCNWTTMLEGMTVNFHDSITESKGEELCKLLLSFSRLAICMKF